MRAGREKPLDRGQSARGCCPSSPQPSGAQRWATRTEGLGCLGSQGPRPPAHLDPKEEAGVHAIDYVKGSFKHFGTQLAQKSLRDLEKEKKYPHTLTGNKCDLQQKSIEWNRGEWQ